MLGAAVLHASWNVLAKRASDDAPPSVFLWLISCTGAVALGPATLVFVLVAHLSLRPIDALFLVGTAFWHTAYFFSLQAGYRRGDLSVVYPLARGTGPMVASLVAIVVLGEHPGPLGGAGIALVVVGLGILALGDRSSSPSPGRVGAGVVFGLLTGLTIGGYTLWDAYAVHHLLVPPILEAWSSEAGRALLLAPFALRRRSAVRAVWRQRRGEVLGTGVFSPLAYLLVLVALSIAPIVEVAPARELSVVLGVLAGRRLLGEGHVRLRLLAALVVAGGVVAIAIG